MTDGSFKADRTNTNALEVPSSARAEGCSLTIRFSERTPAAINGRETTHHPAAWATGNEVKSAPRRLYLVGNVLDKMGSAGHEKRQNPDIDDAVFYGQFHDVFEGGHGEFHVRQMNVGPSSFLPQFPKQALERLKPTWTFTPMGE